MRRTLLTELKYLVTKKHSWWLNNLRTNLAHAKDDIVVDGTWRKFRVSNRTGVQFEVFIRNDENEKSRKERFSCAVSASAEGGTTERTASCEHCQSAGQPLLVGRHCAYHLDSK